MTRLYIRLSLLLACIAAIPVARAGQPRHDPVAIDTIYVARYYNHRPAALSLTFDDGLLDHYTQVVPRLDSLGICGTFWINGATVGTTAAGYASYLSWAQLREMARNGHEISNHSFSHPSLPELDAEMQDREIRHNDDLIEREIGQRPVTFCFPYNAYDDVTYRRVMQNRIACRLEQTAQGQAASGSTFEGMCRWLDGVIASGNWGITMTHGITEGYDRWDDPDELWHFYRYLHDRRGEIWIAPFRDVAAYVSMRDSTRISYRTKGEHTLIITPEATLREVVARHPPRHLTTDISGRRDHDPAGGPLTLVVEGRWEGLEPQIRQGTSRHEYRREPNAIRFDFDPTAGPVTIIFRPAGPDRP